MVIQFKTSGRILFRDGPISMDQNCCCTNNPGTCDACITGTSLPDIVSATFSGIVDRGNPPPADDCTMGGAGVFGVCDDLNATYLLEVDESDACIWTWNNPGGKPCSPCNLNYVKLFTEKTGAGPWFVRVRIVMVTGCSLLRKNIYYKKEVETFSEAEDIDCEVEFNGASIPFDYWDITGSGSGSRDNCDHDSSSVLLEW